MASIDLDEFPTLIAARERWHAGSYDDALARFEQAVTERPHNIRALCESARAWGLRFELRRAEEWLARATEISGDDVRVAIVVAQTYAMIGRVEGAIVAYETVWRRRVLEPPALAALAELYEQTNRLTEAETAVRESAERSAGRPEPQLILARIVRRRGEKAAAESLLLNLTARSDIGLNILAHAWTELAHLRDEQGAFDEAVMCAERSKAVLRQLPEAQMLTEKAHGHNELFRQLYASIDGDTIEAWRAEAGPPDPRCPIPAFLTGFPRTGTTLLEQALAAHPGLVDLPERAIFSQVIFPALYKPTGSEPLTMETLRQLPREHLQALRSRYLDLAEAALGQQLAGRVLLDKNPNHTSLLAGIVRLFPDSRILFSLRDPRDVVVSCYLRLFRLSEFSACFLTWSGSADLYASEMNLWLRIRPQLAGQWLEVRYEDTVADLVSQSQRALEFLGLPWDPGVLAYRDRRVHSHVNSPSHEAVRKPVYNRAVGRWKNYQKHLIPYLHILEPFVKIFGYS